MPHIRHYTLNLWRWKSFQQCSLTWWTLVSKVSLKSVRRDIATRENAVNERTDGQRTDERQVNILPPPRVVGGGIKRWVMESENAKSSFFHVFLSFFTLCFLGIAVLQLHTHFLLSLLYFCYSYYRLCVNFCAPWWRLTDKNKMITYLLTYLLTEHKSRI